MRAFDRPQARGESGNGRSPRGALGDRDASRMEGEETARNEAAGGERDGLRPSLLRACCLRLRGGASVLTETGSEKERSRKRGAGKVLVNSLREGRHTHAHALSHIYKQAHTYILGNPRLGKGIAQRERQRYRRRHPSGSWRAQQAKETATERRIAQSLQAAPNLLLVALLLKGRITILRLNYGCGGALRSLLRPSVHHNFHLNQHSPREEASRRAWRGGDDDEPAEAPNG